MAVKKKTGEWEFDEQDEESIARMQEAIKRDRESNKPKAWDGKTERRGKDSKDRRKPQEPPKKKFWD